MSIFWQEFLKMIGGVTVITAALTWLVRNIIVHFLSKDIEAYKARLSAENQTSLERMRANIQIAAKQQEIRYTKLHEERAELIIELYSILVHALNDISLSRTMCTRDDNDPNHIIKKHISENIRKLKEFFNPKAIFFSKVVCDQLHKYDSLVDIAIHEYPSSDDLEERERQKVHYIPIADQTKEQLTSLLIELEKEFRNMLGVEHLSNQSPSILREVKTLK